MVENGPITGLSVILSHFSLIVMMLDFFFKIKHSIILPNTILKILIIWHDFPPIICFRGFIRGPGDNPKPISFLFHGKFKQGPLLSVVSFTAFFFISIFFFKSVIYNRNMPVISWLINYRCRSMTFFLYR